MMGCNDFCNQAGMGLWLGKKKEGECVYVYVFMLE